MLDSAKLGHTEPSDQSAAKKLTMVVKVKVAHSVFRLDQFCVQMTTDATCTFIQVRVKNWAKSMHFCQIQHNFRCSEYLCKVVKEYLDAMKCKFYAFSRQNSATFDISHAFLPFTTAAKLSTPQNSPFLAHPVIYNSTPKLSAFIRHILHQPIKHTEIFVCVVVVSNILTVK